MAPAGKARVNKEISPAKKSCSLKVMKPTGATAKLLNIAAAWKVKYGEDIERKMLPIIAGISGKSTVRNGYAALKKVNLITTTSTHVIVTEEGMEQSDIGSVTLADRPTTNMEVLEQRKIDLKLTMKGVQVVDFMSDGSIHTKDDIANECFGGKRNSTFRNLMSDLKKKNVFEFVGSSVRLHKDWFPFGGRPE
jgi:hypothetical protein